MSVDYQKATEIQPDALGASSRPQSTHQKWVSNRKLDIVQALNSSLDINRTLYTLYEALSADIALSGLRYDHDDNQLHYKIGTAGDTGFEFSLRLADTQLGTITILRNSNFSKEEISIVEEYLAYLVYPMNNALAHRQAQLEALTDPLTSTMNRTALDSHLRREIDLANRHQQPLAILMLDLDHFKQLNDAYGHSAGDQMLKMFAELLKSTARESDAIFRIGGEEFLIILNKTDASGAQILAERIRANTEQLTFQHKNRVINTSVSIGISVYEAGDNGDSLTERADTALYRAKAAGRNVLSF